MAVCLCHSVLVSVSPCLYACLSLSLSPPLPTQVGNQVSPQELRQVASSPEGVFETKSFEALKTIQVLIRNQIFNIEGKHPVSVAVKLLDERIN